MSVPIKHHYLPKFYLERWARNGELVQYTRPRGNDGDLHCKSRAPAAVGYEPHLYRLLDLQDPVDSQSLELKLFQPIDDRAAKALSKFEALEKPDTDDHLALCQFAISLLYRTPKRLDALKDGLKNQTDGAPYADLSGKEYEDKLHATSRRLLEMLVASDSGLSFVSKFRAGRIAVNGASKSLLTSDRPIMASAQLSANEAFMMLPYAPNRLLILTHHVSIAESFASQNPSKLVAGINQAIVEQSETVVIASDKQATRMIDRLFLRSQSGQNACPAGLIRRKSPLVPL